MTPMLAGLSPCYMPSRHGHGRSKASQSAPEFREQRLPNDLWNSSVKRRCNISRAGGCILRGENCVTARLRLPKFPRALDMIPKQLSGGPFVDS